MKLKCPKCNVIDHEPGAKYCHKCGSPLIGNDKTPHTGMERPKPKEVRGNTLTKIYSGHEYVDLGLPSGTLWATCNVGAANSEESGGYFKYDDIKDILSDWESGWSLPTSEDWMELFQHTDSIHTVQNGIKGILFQSSNGTSLFLPTTDKGELVYGGTYWTGRLNMGNKYDANNAILFSFGANDSCIAYGSYRGNTYSVRLVKHYKCK